MPRKVALISGANRGLGLETARQLGALGWRVLLGARRPEAAEAAAAELARELGEERVQAVWLDTSSLESLQALDPILGREGGLDALVNNAGAILPERSRDSLGCDPAVVLATIDNNALGALRLSRVALPWMRGRPGGSNLVNVSSGMGGIAEMNGGHVGYRLSKAAMNALTRILHAEHHAAGLRVNSVCPGWVRTEMGGQRAPRAVEEGARGIVWAATLEEGGPSGGFFRDGRPIPW